MAPYAAAHNIRAYFARANTGAGTPMQTLWDQVEQAADNGKLTSIKIPLFGSNDGRLNQPCTSRWKTAAIRQTARGLGATALRAALGIHTSEAARRMKGANPRRVDGWLTMNDIDGKISSGPNKGKPRIVQWCTRYHPLVEFRLYRDDIQRELAAAGMPYLITSECDFCPHQDAARWLRHTPERLAEIAALETKFNGEYFFTDRRIPLMQAIELMDKNTNQDSLDLDFGCNNAICGV